MATAQQPLKLWAVLQLRVLQLIAVLKAQIRNLLFWDVFKEFLVSE
jgi:hypothetical protein